LFQFRNQYDSDVTTWSPDGRLHQVEYAMEAVKQGSATVGLKSKTHAVLVTFVKFKIDFVHRCTLILKLFEGGTWGSEKIHGGG
jgi:hypothetical protein